MGNKMDFIKWHPVEGQRGFLHLTEAGKVHHFIWSRFSNSVPTLSISIRPYGWWERESKENYFASIFGQSWQSRLSCLSSCLDLSFSGNIQQWHLKLNTNCLSRFISQLWVEQLAMIHCQSTILTWSWSWLGGEGRASVSRTLLKNFPH